MKNFPARGLLHYSQQSVRPEKSKVQPLAALGEQFLTVK